MTNDLVQFYDAFSDRLIRDYVKGNLRSEAAIDLACRQLEPETTSVLDVGCGIGVSSNRLIQSHPGVHVSAVDISPRNIECAQKLFSDPRIDFQIADMKQPLDGQPFDQINMLDVYEHFPRNDWPALHRVLAQSLHPDGRLVMSIPSPLHQRWLEKCQPEGLQIVDETVELEDVCRIAEDLGATIVLYQMVSIWHRNDYIHIVMTRSPPFLDPRTELPRKRSLWERVMNRATGLAGGLQQRLSKDPSQQRSEHVRQALGISLEQTATTRDASNSS